MMAPSGGGSADAVLACDLGGTTLRLALIDRAGTVLQLHSVPTELSPDGNEGNPDAWWAAFRDGVAAFNPLPAIGAVALTGMTRTTVVLGPAGPLRPAITWRDARAAVVDRLPDDPEAAAVNPFHPVARLLWLRRHEPAVIAQATAVIDPKDELARRLTGITGSDWVSAARLMASRALLARLGLPPVVPPVIAPGAVLGPVRADAIPALAGCPVVLAGHDSWACALGLGALEHGRAYNITGTTEVFGVLSRHAAPADGLVSADWGYSLHQLGGPSASGGGTVAWAMGLLAPGEAVGAAMDRLLAAPASAAPLLFLPHLSGERAPFWDAGLRGAFLGLAAEHGAADLARAVAEGVAFLNRAVLERAETALGLTVDEIRYGGGGAASAAWAQIKADVTGRVVAVTEAAETGLLGAAVAGWRALGEGGTGLVRIRARYAPDPARRARYDRLWALWQQAGVAVRPISHALAGC